MTPMEYMARLAALVPPPRRYLLRYHGALAPRRKVRKLVVPACRSLANCPQATFERAATRVNGTVDESHHTIYINWATLLRRTFEIDVFDCPKCHGRMRVLALLTQPETIHKILEHTGQGKPLSDEPIPNWLEGTDPSPDDLHWVEPCRSDPPGLALIPLTLKHMRTAEQ